MLLRDFLVCKHARLACETCSGIRCAFSTPPRVFGVRVLMVRVFMSFVVVGNKDNGAA